MGNKVQKAPFKQLRPDDDKALRKQCHILERERYEKKTLNIFNGTKLTLLCWNIDGLFKNGTPEAQLEKRVKGILDVIFSSCPDVVMLQEVVEESLQMFEEFCGQYTLRSYKRAHYFNILMIRKDQNISLLSHNVLDFKNSVQGRFILCQTVLYGCQLVSVMVTHLESCADFTMQREEQLKESFAFISQLPPEHMVIYAGDLNCVDEEISHVRVPGWLNDAWVCSGSNESTRITFDMKVNDNRSLPGSPRWRLDRMFFRLPIGSLDKTCELSLVGRERLESCGLFPSDHYGILVQFPLDKKPCC